MIFDYDVSNFLWLINKFSESDALEDEEAETQGNYNYKNWNNS